METIKLFAGTLIPDVQVAVGLTPTLEVLSRFTEAPGALLMQLALGYNEPVGWVNESGEFAQPAKGWQEAGINPYHPDPIYHDQQGQEWRPFYVRVELPDEGKLYVDIPKRLWVRDGFWVRWFVIAPEKARVVVPRWNDGPNTIYETPVPAAELPDGEYVVGRRQADPNDSLYLATEWDLEPGTVPLVAGDVWIVPAHKVRRVTVHDWRTSKP